VGFIGAVGAYGGWLIPQSYGMSISLTGTPFLALESIMLLYLVCMLVLWRNFLRPDLVASRAVLAEAEA
jgi:NNP family nitrate/nitrite transporter-like MFS transporter